MIKEEPIQFGESYCSIKLKNEVVLSYYNFFVCWIDKNTIHAFESNVSSEILQKYNTQKEALVFIELNSILDIDGVKRKISEYRLIDDPSKKYLTIKNKYVTDVASKSWKPDFITNLSIEFNFANIENILCQNLVFSYVDKNRRSPQQVEHKINPKENPEELKLLTTKFIHPIQQLYFLLKYFMDLSHKTEYSSRPIPKLLELYLVRKDEMKFEINSIDLKKYSDAYFNR